MFLSSNLTLGSRIKLGVLKMLKQLKHLYSSLILITLITYFIIESLISKHLIHLKSHILHLHFKFIEITPIFEILHGT